MENIESSILEGLRNKSRMSSKGESRAIYAGHLEQRSEVQKRREEERARLQKQLDTVIARVAQLEEGRKRAERVVETSGDQRLMRLSRSLAEQDQEEYDLCIVKSKQLSEEIVAIDKEMRENKLY